MIWSSPFCRCRLTDRLSMNAEQSRVAAGVLSRGILRLPFLTEWMRCEVKAVSFTTTANKLFAILGWGRRPTTSRALAYAKRHSLPFWALEDGFLRSHGTGDNFPPLSLVVDDIGIYYDSTNPNALEKLLSCESDIMSCISDDPTRAKSLIQQHRLSKYNHAPEFHFSALRNDNEYRVLVVDQTVGDMSVKLGGALAETFTHMLAAACEENPNAVIYLKTHPEVTSGRKCGYLTQTQPTARIVLLHEAINPLMLLAQVDKVYVVTSTMGFEALLAGKPVVCFGVPWYAGWGLTDDRCKDSSAWARRTRQRSVDELFAAAYIHYTRYLNPVTHKRGTIMDVIHWLIRQKEMANRLHGENRTGRVIGVGFRRWKAANIKPMLGLHTSRVWFAASVRAAGKLSPLANDSLVAWGGILPKGLHELASDSGAKVLHAEDGFIRSVGLGSDLIRPQSLVLDERGIYFDATRESDLEHILNTETFSQEEFVTARKVRELIVEHGITKYNLEPRHTVSWATAGRRVVLVPGQVEDDASIRLGCTTIRTNLALLQAVRNANPDAFIVYKPHPDVLSMNRKGKVALEAARRFADHVETEVSIVSCIEACDEVHTMTSLSGFDALLREKIVVTYGQPFYAGWGLTTDLAENPIAFARRTRRLSLDELVAGALLRYPIYWDWELRGYTTCEAVLHRIVEQRSALEASGGLHRLRVGFMRRQARKLRILARAWLGSLGVLRGPV